MRFLAAIAAATVLASTAQAQAQGQKPKEAMKHDMGKHDMGKMDHMAGPWKEMNAFHSLLGATFHPAKDKKDVKPLREKADALAAAARAWTASTPPAACADAATRSTVATISTDALALGNQVLANAPDTELITAITALHDKFEAVEKKCAPHDMKGMKH